MVTIMTGFWRRLWAVRLCRLAPPDHDEREHDLAMVTRRDLQRATTRVEARLGSPDGYQTFDTGTNRSTGPEDRPGRAVRGSASGEGVLKVTFNDDGTFDVVITTGL